MTHVLVVEADPDLRAELREILEAAGHAVTVAEGGDEALEKAQKNGL
ncbi:MAG: hypothetical protein VW268_04795 [Rhodospirillaceae bacterium]